MPDRHSFGQSLKAACLGLSILAVTACTTTQPPVQTTPRGPVVEYPSQPDRPTPADTDTETPDETVIDRPVDEADDRTDDRVAEPGVYFNNRDGLTPPHMAGRDTKRLALLLPFSASSSRLAQEAQSMYRAAELAVFERNTPDVLLIALDTKGTDEGARSATRAAVNAGADVILGPIIADNVRASSRAAKRSGTPVIAFSNDQRVAGDGTYLMSFPPEAEVERIVDFAASTGATRFAYLGPNGGYGDRVRTAYDRRVSEIGGQVTASESYTGNDISVMQTPAQKLAAFHAEGEARARRNGGATPLSFEAILLPEGGTPLRSLAPLLPFYNVDPGQVQFMGTSRWSDPDTVREPALNRGIFAGPDKDVRRDFLESYDRTYGETPSSLASLAYDAVTMGAYVADGDPKRRYSRAENPSGFYGVDGLVSFGPRRTTPARPRRLPDPQWSLCRSRPRPAHGSGRKLMHQIPLDETLELHLGAKPEYEDCETQELS